MKMRNGVVVFVLVTAAVVGIGNVSYGLRICRKGESFDLPLYALEEWWGERRTGKNPRLGFRILAASFSSEIHCPSPGSHLPVQFPHSQSWLWSHWTSPRPVTYDSGGRKTNKQTMVKALLFFSYPRQQLTAKNYPSPYAFDMTHGCLLVSPLQGQTQTLQVPSLFLINDQLPSCSQWSIETKLFFDLPEPAPRLLLGMDWPQILRCTSVQSPLSPSSHAPTSCSFQFCLPPPTKETLLFPNTWDTCRSYSHSILPIPIVVPLLQEFLSFPWNNSSQSSLSWLNLDLIFIWQLPALDQMTFLKPKADCVHFTAPVLQIFSLKQRIHR